MKKLHYIYLSVCMWVPLYASEEQLPNVPEHVPAEEPRHIVAQELPHIPEDNVIHPRIGVPFFINNKPYTIDDVEEVLEQTPQGVVKLPLNEVMFLRQGYVVRINNAWYKVGGLVQELPHIPEGNVIYPRLGVPFTINGKPYTIADVTEVLEQIPQGFIKLPLKDVMFLRQGYVVRINNAWYRVGNAVEEVADAIAKTDLKTEALHKVQEKVDEIQEQEDVPDACKRELTILMEEKRDQLALHRYNTENFYKKNTHTLAMMRVMRQQHPDTANGIMNELGQDGAEAFKVFVDKQQEQAAPEAKQEEVKEEEPLFVEKKEEKISLPKEQKPALTEEQGEVPVEEPPKEEEKEQIQPQEQEELEVPTEEESEDITEEDLLRELEEVTKTLEERKKVRALQEQEVEQFNDMLLRLAEQCLGMLKKVIQVRTDDFQLVTLHEQVYKAASDNIQANRVASALNALSNDMREFSSDMYELLYALDIPNLPQETQDAQQQLQIALDTLFAHILIMFDALIAGIFDEEEAIFKEQEALDEEARSFLSGITSFFSGRNIEEEKKKSKIQHFQNIKSALSNMRPYIIPLIGSFVRTFTEYMDSMPIFESHNFDVTLYAKVKDLAGKYIYGRTTIEEEKQITVVNEYHRKKEEYSEILDGYYNGIIKALEDLATSSTSSTEPPLIKPSYKEWEEREEAPGFEPPSYSLPFVQETIEKIQTQPEPITPAPVPEEPKQPEVAPTIEQPSEKPSQELEKREELEEVKEMAEEEFAPIQPFEQKPGEEIEQPAEEIQEQPVVEQKEEEIIPELEVVPQPETIEPSQAEFLASKYAELEASIININSRTQELKTAQKQDEATWDRLILSTQELNTFLTPLISIRMGETDEDKKQSIIEKLSTAFTDYANQLIEMACIDVKIDEYSLATLHSYIHARPFELQKAYDHINAISTDPSFAKVIDHLGVITNRGFTLSLSSCDTALCLLSAIFDACASGLMNNDILKEQEAETLKEKYAQTIDVLSTFTTQLEPLTSVLIPYCTSETAAAYESGSLDITSLAPDLMQDESYIYAVPAGESFTLDTTTMKTVAIDALHKKEYATLLDPLRTGLKAEEKRASLQNITQAENIEYASPEDLAQYLADLDEIQEFITPEEYEELKAALEKQQQELSEMQVFLDAILEAFHASITKATEDLERLFPNFTVVNFASEYATVERLLDSNPGLKTTYESKVNDMIISFETYLTTALKTMITRTGLDKLHIAVQGKTQQARESIKKAINEDAIYRIRDMLNQLKKENLFGVDSTADYNTVAGKDLQLALIQGYAYILVAYDALESTLYENFSTQEKINQWVQYLWTIGDQGNETLYDKAIATLDQVMNILNNAREVYYTTLIDPFFDGEGSGSYKDAYNKSILDVNNFGLENVTNENGQYRYKRQGARYKDIGLSVPAITSKHKKDYAKIANDWKEDLAIIYAPELLAQEQKAFVEHIRETFPDFAMKEYISRLEHNRNEVIEMLNDRMKLYPGIASKLKEFADKNAFTVDMQNELQLSFMYLLGMFDGLFAHIYDLIKKHNETTDKQSQEFIETQIARLITSVGALIVDAIESFYNHFKRYFSQDFTDKFNETELLIGQSIGAVTYLDPQRIHQLYIFERPQGYHDNFPSRVLFPNETLYDIEIEKYKQESSIKLVVNNAKRQYFIFQQHKKPYRKFLNNWNPIIQAIQQETPVAPQQVSPDLSLIQNAFTQEYAGITLNNLPSLIDHDPTAARTAIQAMIEHIPFDQISTILAQANSVEREVYRKILDVVAQILLQAYEETQPVKIPSQEEFSLMESMRSTGD